MIPRDEYYRSLPRRYVSAGVLITDSAGRVLLLETTYKQQFEIPGGVCEAGEAPRETAIREVREELGIHLKPGALLMMDHRSQPEPKGDSIQFIYDGGVLDDLAEIRLDSTEIASSHLLSPDEIDAHTTPTLAFRVRTALRAREEHSPIELRDGEEIG